MADTESTLDNKATVSTTNFSLNQPILYSLLQDKKSILFAGCGGGYDFLSSIPLYLSLKSLGKKVTIVNHSFTNITMASKENKDDVILKHCLRVHGNTKITNLSYFPEYYTCKWFNKVMNEPNFEIFAIQRCPPTREMTECIQWICNEYKIDAILLFDGGTDSLMFGNEIELGTPIEDQTSIAAIDMITGVELKLHLCIGFGVDSFHGVNHGLFLENVATLEMEGAFYGSFSISRLTKEAQLYIDCYTYIETEMQSSIVCSSIINSIQGHFGNFHSTPRTKGSKLFLNHLMAILWTFNLTSLACKIPYLSEIKNSGSYLQTNSIIENYRRNVITIPLRKGIPLPM